ncbi:hypothetical protein GUT183_11030 [Streptococcus ruminantium]|nr:hypothetical protein GUT183_11030 [Streptococcus ruminantium]
MGELLMNSLYILSKHQTKMLMRNSKSTIVGFLVPVIMFFVFSNLLGSYSIDSTGRTITEYLIPAYIPIIIINAVVVIFGQYYILYKERGDLLKYKLMGISSVTVASAIFFSTIIFQVIATALLVAVGYFTKGVAFPLANIPSILIALIILNFYQFSIAYFVVSLLSKSTTYQSIAAVIFYFQMFLGGLTFPPEMFPDVLKKVMYFINPIVYGLQIMRGVWTDGEIIFNFGKEIAILVVVSVSLVLLGSFVNKKTKEF